VARGAPSVRALAPSAASSESRRTGSSAPQGLDPDARGARRGRSASRWHRSGRAGGSPRGRAGRQATGRL